VLTEIAAVLAAVFSLTGLIAVLVSRRGRNQDRVLESAISQQFGISRAETSASASQLRTELSGKLDSATGALATTLGEMGRAQGERLDAFAAGIGQLAQTSENKAEAVRVTLEARIAALQESNEKKLDQMRETVDTRLQTTLQGTLASSFNSVRENLEAVQKGLGEMRALAAGVGDLKRVLTNVKARGTWGEVQLQALLEEVLTPDQFSRFVKVRPGSDEQVDFAVKLPGRGDSAESIWLPIDSKFPQEDYQRVLLAVENGDPKMLDEAGQALSKRIDSFARDISQKYVCPPVTTDFAIMFLPSEGLYSEVLRRPGQAEDLQSRYRVLVAGPTTLMAILNSFRLGFRTLAIEKHSSEVWVLLAAVKTEFAKFGSNLEKARKQLDSASNTLEDTGKRSRAIERKLRSIEELPDEEAGRILGPLEVEDAMNGDPPPDQPPELL